MNLASSPVSTGFQLYRFRQLIKFKRPTSYRYTEQSHNRRKVKRNQPCRHSRIPRRLCDNCQCQHSYFFQCTYGYFLDCTKVSCKSTENYFIYIFLSTKLIQLKLLNQRRVFLSFLFLTNLQQKSKVFFLTKVKLSCFPRKTY